MITKNKMHESKQWQLFLVSFLLLVLIVLFSAPSIYNKSVLNYKKSLVEAKFPKYKNFEKQESFAGKYVYNQKIGSDYYFGYFTAGSGVYFVDGVCFKVTPKKEVSVVGELNKDTTSPKIDLTVCEEVK